MVDWEHVEKDLEKGETHDHLVALDDTGYVTMRLRSINNEDGDWVTAWTCQLRGSKWSLPQIEDWMVRVAAKINEELLGDPHARH